MGFVTRSGTQLMLNGAPFTATGFDLPYCIAAERATPGYLAAGLANWGSHPKVARVFCSQTRNIVSGALNFTVLDSILATFATYGIKVILALGWNGNNMGGPNDDGAVKDMPWWLGGSPNGYDYVIQSGSTPAQVVTYLSYVETIVTRYASNQTVMMWQLMNEAQAVLTGSYVENDAYAAMGAFATTVGAIVKGIDSNHLISLGNILGYNGGGGGQQWTGSLTYYLPPAATNPQHYRGLLNNAYLDVGDYHDYGYPLNWGGLTNTLSPVIGLPGALAIGAAVGKPIMVGECGIYWTNPQAGQAAISPATIAKRATLLQNKFSGMFAAGVALICVWSWRNAPASGDGNDYGAEVGPSDPVLALMAPPSPAGLRFLTDGTSRYRLG